MPEVIPLHLGLLLHKLISFCLVGFTGSGQQMRKDPARMRHIYQQNDEDGY